MNPDQIDGLIRGMTLYHRLAPGSPQGAGEVAFFFGEDGRAAARLPDGRRLAGAWTVEGDAYRLDWDDGLKNSRTALSKEDGAIVARNAADGSVRSTVFKLAPGNPEAL